MLRLVQSPFLPLVAFSLLQSIAYGTYVVYGVTPSVATVYSTSLVWRVLMPLWLFRDAGRRMGVSFFDFGLYCYLFFPVVVLCYCFWSRGWWGFLVLAKLAGLYVAPYVVSMAIYLLFFK